MVTRLAVIDRVGYHIEMLAELLGSQPDFEVAAIATIYEDFIDSARQAEIAVVLQEQGADLTRRLIQRICGDLPETRVVVVSVPDDPQTILSYIEAGARGYVREKDSTERLLETIRAVAAGEAYAHPELIAPLFERLAALGAVVQELTPPDAGHVTLTPRQAQIAELIAQDLSNEQIAERLGIADGTVKNHVHAILRAFDADSRHQVAMIYRHLRRSQASAASDRGEAAS